MVVTNLFRIRRKIYYSLVLRITFEMHVLKTLDAVQGQLAEVCWVALCIGKLPDAYQMLLQMVLSSSFTITITGLNFVFSFVWLVCIFYEHIFKETAVVQIFHLYFRQMLTKKV